MQSLMILWVSFVATVSGLKTSYYEVKPEVAGDGVKKLTKAFVECGKANHKSPGSPNHPFTANNFP